MAEALTVRQQDALRAVQRSFAEAEIAPGGFWIERVLTRRYGHPTLRKRVRSWWPTYQV